MNAPGEEYWEGKPGNWCHPGNLGRAEHVLASAVLRVGTRNIYSRTRGSFHCCFPAGRNRALECPELSNKLLNKRLTVQGTVLLEGERVKLCW